MILSLNDLYQYVFGNWAKIEDVLDQKIQLDEKKKAEVLSKRKDEKIARIKKFFFDEVDEHKKPKLFISDYKKNRFRELLRAFKATDLEKLLFGNATDSVGNYSFPDDAAIEEAFKRENAIYHYFNQNNSPEFKEKNAAELERYKKFFKISKFIADVIEDNNDHFNSVAYEHAYKLMVAFGQTPDNDFKPIDSYLKAYLSNKSTKTPLHDALMNPIPKKDKFNLGNWQNLIQTHAGILDLFPMAVAIEKQLNDKTPTNYSEAVDAAKKVQYKMADTDPELAKLCFLFRQSEELFNRCLAVRANRKSKDNLPTISVDGVDIDNPDYHLVKLPIDDPHAYLLGKITNCCQSIGGHSQQCVIDGITRENNGFYVLLKANKANKANKSNKEIKAEKENKANKQQPSPLDKNAKINYADYDIVGQGYAWISTQHNLVFDSWENLTPEKDDPIIAKMLEKFAQTLTKDAASNFIRVTIGTGGKTPEILLKKIIKYPEIILEGAQYGDSLEQSEIYCNEFLRDEYLKQVDLTVDHYFKPTSDSKEQSNSLELIKSWAKNSCYSKKYIDLLNKSLKETAEIWTYLLGLENDRLKKICNTSCEMYLDTELFLKFKQLKLKNYHENYLAMLTSDRPVKDYHNALDILINNKLHDNELICSAVFALKNSKYSNFCNPYFTDKYVNAFIKLKKLELDDDLEILQGILLVRSSDRIAAIVDSFENLVNEKLKINDKIRKVILKYGSKRISDAIVRLRKINIHLEDEKESELLKFIVESKDWQITRVFDCLETLSGMIDLENNPIKYKIINDERDAKKHQIEELKEMKLDAAQKKVLANLILEYGTFHQEILKTYSMIKANNLENIPDLCLKLYTYDHSTTEGFITILAYRRLCELKLENDPAIRKVFLNTRQPQYFVSSLDELRKSNFENDSQFKQVVLNNPGSSGTFTKNLILIKRYGFENDNEVRQCALSNPDRELGYFLNNLSELKELNLVQFDFIRDLLIKNLDDYTRIYKTFTELNKLGLGNDLDIRERLFAKYDSEGAECVIVCLKRLQLIELDKDPEIKMRILQLYGDRKNNSMISLTDTLIELKNNKINMDSEINSKKIKNIILEEDFPKLILYDILESKEAFASKKTYLTTLFSNLLRKPDDVASSASDKELLKKFKEQYEKGKVIIREFLNHDKKGIENIEKRIYSYDKHSHIEQGYWRTKVPNTTIFDNEYFVIMVGGGYLDLAWLVSEGKNIVKKLSEMNMFSEDGVKALEKKHITIDELKSEEIEDSQLQKFMLKGCSLLSAQGFYIKDFIKLKPADREDVYRYLLCPKGLLAIQHNNINVEQFLKIEPENRRDFIADLEIKPAQEVKPDSPKL